MELDTNDIQALVFSGHGKLRHSVALGFKVADGAAARGQLRELLVHEITYGMGRGERTRAVQLLLSSAGLASLEVAKDQTAELDAAFQEGMVTTQRSRALGDRLKNDPTKWNWTDQQVHALLLLYAHDSAELSALQQKLKRFLSTGFTPVFELSICSPKDRREPFGFRDGITSVRIDIGNGKQAEPGFDLVAAGEVLLGQRTQNGEVRIPPPIGVGGAYLTVRQLEQDVEGFWKFWLAQAEGNEEGAIWLAAKAVGRWPNGMPVRTDSPGPQPKAVEEEILASLSFDRDREGRGCPLGAHIRRANPRDALEEDADLSRRIVAHHRIIRRGRMYGRRATATWYPKSLSPPQLDAEGVSDITARGLLFMSLCSDLTRQFEFIQQTWLNNPKFADLYDEVDVIASGEGIPADSGRFSIPRHPLRQRISHVARWTTVRAGGYFLLPGKEALRKSLG